MRNNKSHPWKQFNPSFLSNKKVSEDQQKIIDRAKAASATHSTNDTSAIPLVKSSVDEPVAPLVRGAKGYLILGAKQ